MTARGTRCLVEVVTERADGRVVETVGVLLHQRVEAQVHEAAGRGHAGALPVDVAGGAVAVGLAGLERLAGERRDRPRRGPRRPSAVYPPAMELLRPAARVIMSATADCESSCWRCGSSPASMSAHDVAGKRDHQDTLHRGVLPDGAGAAARRRRRRTSSATRHRGDERDRGAADHGSTARSGSMGSNAGLEARAALGATCAAAAGRGPAR